MEFTRLNSKITVNGMQLRNRIMMVAMHHLYTEDGFCTPKFTEYYLKRARGGAGLIIVGACRFDDYGAKESCISLRDDEHIPGWKAFTDRIHAESGAKVAVQLYHAGRYMPKADVPCGKEALAPSAVYSTYTREVAKEATEAELAEIIENWAAAAVRAKKAGFDAVELIGSVGYLISQFLSPTTNLRTDKYGGSWENRCRFPLEAIRAVRAAVGKDYPLILRMCCSDLIPGANTEDELAVFARLAQDAGVDMLDVTGGWHESRVPQLTGDAPGAALEFLQKKIKEAVTIPVAIATRFGDPEKAEEALALGHGDIIGMGRPLLADPELPEKAFSGRAGEIRPCVACNQGCLANTFFDRPIVCLVNGMAGREYEIKFEKTEKPKEILVIGAGPAGCEFAIRAASRGHRVTIWEKSGEPGGMLKYVAKLPARQEFSRLIKYYETALKAAGVRVELNKEARPDNVPESFDTVMLASGAVYQPVIPENCGVPAYSVTQVVKREVMPGKNVVVLDGTYMGCETARYLARSASVNPEQLYHRMVYGATSQEKIDASLRECDRNIAIVAEGPKIGGGYESGTSWPVMMDLNRLGVKKYKSAVLESISGGKAAFKDENGQQTELCCDCVIVPEKRTPEEEMKKALEDRGFEVLSAGDAEAPAKAINAIHRACELGMRV